MEIKDYLRLLGRRMWVLVLIPLLATAAALVYAVQQPAQYQSSVTVFAHPGSAGAGSVIQYVSAFQAAMKSDALLNRVAHDTKANVANLQSNLTVAPTSVNSLILKVTFTSISLSKAALVPNVAARDTLSQLAEPDVAVAQSQLDSAQKQLTAAQQAVDQFIKASGVPAPLETYRAEAGELAQLRVSYEQAALTGQQKSSGLEALVAAAEQRLAQLGATVQQYTPLQGAADRAASAVGNAQDKLIAAQAELALINDQSAVAPGDTVKLSPVATIIKTVGPAAVVGFILAVGLVLAIEMRSTSPAAVEAGSTPGDAAPVAGNTAPVAGGAPPEAPAGGAVAPPDPAPWSSAPRAPFGGSTDEPTTEAPAVTDGEATRSRWFRTSTRP